MYWNWKIGGIALGLIFFAAVALVKPIGVSTQFVILDGIQKLKSLSEQVRGEVCQIGGQSLEL